MASGPRVRLASVRAIEVPDPVENTSAQPTDTPSTQPASGDDGGGGSPDLSFVDLLYAVPVADLAVRVSATRLHHVQPSGWTDVALTLTTITFGWTAHHNNRSELPPSITKRRQKPTRPFTNARVRKRVRPTASDRRVSILRVCAGVVRRSWRS
jgi:hypothetical protein